MSITKEEIEKYFAVNDIVASGGGRRYFEITKILNDRVWIEPTEADTASRLRYDKLSVVIDNFKDIDPNRIEASVGEVLKENNLKDTQNESYLYGMAREYLYRRQDRNVIWASVIQSNFDKDVETAKKSTSAQRKARLENASKRPEPIVVTSTVYKRNPDVVAEVLERANGTCENCTCPAPFVRAKDGSPYLEVHHKTQLAHGGDDSVENAIALCPNCHRKKHFGINI